MATTPSAQFSLTIRVEIADRPGMLGRVASAIGDAGGTIGAVDLVAIDGGRTVRDITVDCAPSRRPWGAITAAIEALDGARVVDTTDRTFQMHLGGKIEQRNKLPLKTRDDLSMAYTPGVARVCMAIDEDPDKAFQYTIKRNTVAVVSDGTAVLGLGDIGPAAAMPVMEGKAMLFKEFAGVDAFPICLDTKDPDEIVATVKAIAPTFGGINLEDISAPRCFEIEDRLIEAARHPRLPRRPARHRRRRARRAAERREADRPPHRRPARARRRPRRRRRRGHEDPDEAPASRDIDRLRLARRGPHRARRLPRRLDERDQALVRRAHEPRAARRRPRRRDRRHGPVHRPLGRARDAAPRRSRA